MKTDFEKDNVDYLSRKLLKIIDPYCYKFNDVAGLMKNCLTQHDIIHALLKILKDRFHGNTYDNIMKAGGPMVSGYKPEGTVSIAFNVLFDGIMSFFKSIEDDYQGSDEGRREYKRG